jgi:hypothetical protein
LVLFHDAKAVPSVSARLAAVALAPNCPGVGTAVGFSVLAPDSAVVVSLPDPSPYIATGGLLAL